ncbi:unnamed protein product [Discosporangium mesarthrocarpum]
MTPIALLLWQAYKNLKGHTNIPSSFVVPPAHPWPPVCWGMRLGVTLVDIRSKNR